MKSAASMLLGILVLVFRMDLAAATVITVNVTGHVIWMGDGTDRAAILCPDAGRIFQLPLGPPGPPVPLTVNWQVTLTDGTILNQSVAWSPVP